MAVEWIKNENTVLALIISGDYAPNKTEFLTPDSYKQQVGFIVYNKDEEIIPHVHKSFERKISGTSEVIFVRQGHCWVDFYLDDKSYYCSREIKTGDVVLLVDGGHGFRLLEDTILIEVKQGPYVGLEDKIRFESHTFES